MDNITKESTLKFEVKSRLEIQNKNKYFTKELVVLTLFGLPHLLVMDESIISSIAMYLVAGSS